MKNILKNKSILMVTFLILYLMVEITTFLWIDFNFLPKNFLIDLIIVLAISSLVILFKSNKGSMIYLSVIYLIVVLLFIVNATMYDVYLDLFTIQQFQLLGEAAGVVNIEHISFVSIVIGFVFIVLFLFIMRFIYIKLQDINLSNKEYYKRSLSVLALLFLAIFGFFSLNTDEIVDFTENENVAMTKRSSFQTYGLAGYYVKEVENLFVSPDHSNSVVNPSLSQPTEYFGLLEDKNVITILLESVQSFGVNETLTPNLYQLTQDGLYFDQSYSENKTNHSELISILGNYPMTPVNFNSYTYDFSYGMPQTLSDEGYTTSYFHDNVATFYSRGLLMPNLGFENVYLHEELYPGEDIWGWNGDYTLDSVTMEKILPFFQESDEPFYTFWASLSTHGPYDYGPKNKRIFEERGYFDEIDQAEAGGLWTNILAGKDDKDVARIRHYQAAMMDLDEAIGMMITDLEEKDLLDDTVIVMYGDHNVYYHEIYLKWFEGDNDISNMEMYHNFFCIYNPTLTHSYLSNSGAEHTTISTFVSPYSIVPTLYDLLGIQYDTNLFIGSSIFDDTEDVFYSLKITSFFDDNFFSDDGVNILYNRNNLDEDAIQEFKDKCALIKEKISSVNYRYTSSKESRDLE